MAMLIHPLQRGDASDVTVDIRADAGLFYEQLAPYGVWVTIKSGDLVWIPTQTPVDWRPYTIGRWSYTQEHGWFWNSGWPWGWATFHYGRWLFDSDYGWAWKPGSQWAPAWVAWRVGNGLIGWAPLSPEVKLASGEQQLSDQELDKSIDVYSWSFVPIKDIFSTNLHAKAIIMSARNVTMIHETTSSSRYQIDEKRVVNYGVEPLKLLHEYGIDIRRLEMVDVTFPGGLEATHLNENQMAVFRPRVDLESKVAPPVGASELDKLSKDALLKQHKNLKSTLEMYHMLEDKAIERIHTQQTAESDNANRAALETQQKSELDSLERLHTREQDVLMKRFERELRQVGDR
jgi:hypothetical protein